MVRTPRNVVSIGAVLALAGCSVWARATGGGPSAPLRREDGGACGLVARFDPSRVAFGHDMNPAAFTVRIENRGAVPATLDLDTTSSAILGLAFFDAAGRPVYTVPPGVPPADYHPRTMTLAPRASTRVVIDSLTVFSPPLAPGRYTARVRALGSCSERVEFTVAR